MSDIHPILSLPIYFSSDSALKPCALIEYSEDSKTMLEIDLRAEKETIKNYRERIRQAEHAGEFALSEKLRTIIAQEQEQDHEIDLKDALGLH